MLHARLPCESAATPPGPQLLNMVEAGFYGALTWIVTILVAIETTRLSSSDQDPDLQQRFLFLTNLAVYGALPAFVATALLMHLRLSSALRIADLFYVDPKMLAPEAGGAAKLRRSAIDRASIVASSKRRSLSGAMAPAPRPSSSKVAPVPNASDRGPLPPGRPSRLGQAPETAGATARASMEGFRGRERRGKSRFSAEGGAAKGMRCSMDGSDVTAGTVGQRYTSRVGVLSGAFSRTRVSVDGAPMPPSPGMRAGNAPAGAGVSLAEALRMGGARGSMVRATAGFIAAGAAGQEKEAGGVGGSNPRLSASKAPPSSRGSMVREALATGGVRGSMVRGAIEGGRRSSIAREDTGMGAGSRRRSVGGYESAGDGGGGVKSMEDIEENLPWYPFRSPYEVRIISLGIRSEARTRWG